ncbi:SprB repeat-containing protein, partial [Salinivirga cyanobacteriivorans]
MRRIILLITSIFLLSTLAAENSYWTNNSGNWIKAGLSSGKQMNAHLNGKIPGKATAHILVGPNTRAAQTDNNERLLAPHQSIAATSNTNLSPAGNKKTQPGVSPQTTKNVMPKGDSNQNNDNQISNQGKKSAQTPDNDIKSGSKAAPTIDSVVVTHASCFNTNDGFIDIYPDDATIDEYSIDSGDTWQASNSFGPLGPGFYRIAARQGTDTTYLNDSLIEVTAPDQLVYDSADIKNVTCNGDADGEITIYVSGGTAPYTYNGGGTLVQTGDNHFTGLDYGAYTFQITDDNGCPTGNLETDKLIVDEAPVFSITDVEVTDILCGGSGDGSIDITVDGGEPPYTYRIEGVNSGDIFTFTTTNTSHLFENLDGDKYDVYATDDYGCEFYYGQPTLDEPAPLQITNVDLTNVTGCAGNANGAIEITSTGGSGDILYSINNETSYFLNGGDFTNITAGTYNIWVKDENDCKINYGEVTLTEPDSINISDVSTTDVTGCAGNTNGSINIAASGGTGTLYYSINGDNAA